MIRKIGTAILLLAFANAAIAQSGRNKPAEAAPPKPPRARIELPDARSAAAIKPTPAPSATPPKTDESKTSEPDADDEVITVEAALVPIPVSVTDQSGGAVANLRLEDFELRVGGELQTISEISRAETPVRLTMLFDNSSSVTAAREFEKKAAVKFFKRVLRPNKDQAALYSVSSITQLIQRFTNNPGLLVQTIERFPEPAGATALLDGVLLASNYLSETSDARRVIVIVSDGVDTNSEITLEPNGFDLVVRQAQLMNCQVYVVKTTDFENFARTGQRGNNANLRDLAAERRMQELAAQTGGAVYSPLDDKELEQAFARIAAELSEQYVLSYYPNETKADGSFKPISLAVKSNKNLIVRTRKGYFVPKS